MSQIGGSDKSNNQLPSVFIDNYQDDAVKYAFENPSFFMLTDRVQKRSSFKKNRSSQID